MKAEKNHFAIGIYTILFGLLGLNDFYFAKYKRGFVRMVMLILSLCYFSLWQAQLRISLSHYELIDNLYTPTYTNSNATILFVSDIAATSLFVICIICWLYDLYKFFTMRKKESIQTISRKRYILTAILLGWTGIHDYLAERAKYANTHIILLILSIALIVISRISGSIAITSILTITSVAILLANEIIAIIEAFNFTIAKHEKRGKAKK